MLVGPGASRPSVVSTMPGSSAMASKMSRRELEALTRRYVAEIVDVLQHHARHDHARRSILEGQVGGVTTNDVDTRSPGTCGAGERR